MQIIGRLNKSLIILFFILAVASFLRLWKLGQIPVGFTPDEASFGYDAYSILHTGRDQWGHFMPIVLESFGDYKSPLYSYLALPSVAVFGLNEFAVRLPNALIGVLAVYVLYLLAGEIGKIANLEVKKIQLLQVSSALLLAISSWHVMMSRGAFEANLVTVFIPLGIYLFLKGVENHKYFVVSALVFGLSLFTYHSAKLLTPIILVALAAIFWKRLLLNRKKLVMPLAIFLIFFAGLIFTFKIGGGTRITERSITQGSLEEGAKAKISAIQNGENPTIAKITHNKYQVTAQRFISNYSQYFSLDFLFTKGPAETTYGMIPGIGVLYAFEGLFLLGLIPLLMINKSSRNIVTVIVFWLLISPLPAALSTGVGYAANRAEGMLPILQILMSLGILGYLEFLKRIDKKVLYIAALIIAVIAGNNLVVVWKTYIVNSPRIAAPGMLYGRGEAVKYSNTNMDKYKEILISRTLSEPQIYVAFYTKYNPADFQKNSQNWGIYKNQNLSFLDQLGEYRLGKYIFKNIEFKTDSKLKNTLLIGKPDEFPASVNPISVIYLPDGAKDIIIVETPPVIDQSLKSR